MLGGEKEGRKEGKGMMRGDHQQQQQKTAKIEMADTHDDDDWPPRRNVSLAANFQDWNSSLCYIAIHQLHEA